MIYLSGWRAIYREHTPFSQPTHIRFIYYREPVMRPRRMRWEITYKKLSTMLQGFGFWPRTWPAISVNGCATLNYCLPTQCGATFFSFFVLYFSWAQKSSRGKISPYLNSSPSKPLYLGVHAFQSALGVSRGEKRTHTNPEGCPRISHTMQVYVMFS